MIMFVVIVTTCNYYQHTIAMLSVIATTIQYNASLRGKYHSYCNKTEKRGPKF
jgi:hypothetical protein